MIGLCCRILSLLSGSFAKETYNFIDPTDRSHPIAPSQESPKITGEPLRGVVPCEEGRASCQVPHKKVPCEVQDLSAVRKETLLK